MQGSCAHVDCPTCGMSSPRLPCPRYILNGHGELPPYPVVVACKQGLHRTDLQEDELLTGRYMPARHWAGKRMAEVESAIFRGLLC
jgi:hypothetical protein